MTILKKTLEKMLKDDETFERGLNHTNSLYILIKFLVVNVKNLLFIGLIETCEWYNGIEIKRKVEETINTF